MVLLFAVIVVLTSAWRVQHENRWNWCMAPIPLSGTGWLTVAIGDEVIDGLAMLLHTRRYEGFQLGTQPRAQSWWLPSVREMGVDEWCMPQTHFIYGHIYNALSAINNVLSLNSDLSLITFGLFDIALWLHGQMPKIHKNQSPTTSDLGENAIAVFFFSKILAVRHRTLTTNDAGKVLFFFFSLPLYCMGDMLSCCLFWWCLVDLLFICWD